MPTRVRFVVSAGPAIGRGHIARALSLAEAAWPSDSEMELEVLGGAPLTQRELERWAAVGGRSIRPDDPLGDGTVVVLDVPDPDAVAGRIRPAPTGGVRRS